jgi:hypothetical protein
MIWDSAASHNVLFIDVCTNVGSNMIWSFIIICQKISCLLHPRQYSQDTLQLHAHVPHPCRIEYFRIGSWPLETLRNNDNFFTKHLFQIFIKFEASCCTCVDCMLYLQSQNKNKITDAGYIHSDVTLSQTTGINFRRCHVTSVLWMVSHICFSWYLLQL